MLPAPDGEVNDIPIAASGPHRVRRTHSPSGSRAAGLILGFGYDDSQLAEQRHPTREDLDAVSTDIPVVIIHQSGHIGVLNSKALEIVGFDASTPGTSRRRHPARGRRDAERRARGDALLRGADGRFLATLDETRMRIMFRAGTELLASYGYTTAQEGRSNAGQARTHAGGGQRRGADDRRRRLSRRARRPRFHRRERPARLCRRLPRRRGEADDRRLAAGLHRLARPALLQPAAELPRRLCGLCRRDERPGLRRHRLGLRERHPDPDAFERRSARRTS